MSRAPDIDDSDSPGLDARAIVQGHCVESAPTSSAVVQKPEWFGRATLSATAPGPSSPTTCSCTTMERGTASAPRSTFAVFSGETEPLPASTCGVHAPQPRVSRESGQY